jgi:hypothetical protein
MTLQGTQHSVQADGWIHTPKLTLFAALDFIRFIGESTPLRPLVTRAVGRALGFNEDQSL